MKKIFKYGGEVKDTFRLSLPKGAEVLSAISQYDKPFVYAMVDPDVSETEDFIFEMYGTGHEIRHDDKFSFLGTIPLYGGQIIFHLFYKKI
jgi:hypothetical protein